MKTNLKFQPTLKQTLHLSTSMKNHLEILNMSSEKIIDHIRQLADRNPFIEFNPNEDIHELLMNNISTAPVLKDELYFQLHTCNRKYDSAITSYIIESLDENGFFNIPIEQACNDLHVPEDKFIQNLNLIQTFEPCGVAAKNSIDSLYIQLSRNNQTPALKLLKNYQNELLNNDLSSICKQMNLSFDQVENILLEIRKCNPYPCNMYTTQKTQWILPDVEIKIEDGDIIIEPKEIGDVKYIKPQEKIIDPELKQYLNQAKFTIDSLNKRNKTLLVVANEIINKQKGYFLYSDELKPLTLKELAKSTSLSESTISRTVNSKYYLYQNQVYPFRSLFTSKTKEGTSRDSIQKALLYLIENEDPNAPLLDEEIVEQLKDLELFVSRRTISKYRKEMRILNSKQRKKAYNSHT